MSIKTLGFTTHRQAGSFTQAEPPGNSQTRAGVGSILPQNPEAGMPLLAEHGIVFKGLATSETSAARTRLKFVTRLTLAVSISVAAFAQDPAFSIPPVRTSFNTGGKPLTIITTGIVSRNGQGVNLKLSADLFDLQDHVSDLLAAQLNRSERCGERLSLERASIQPAAPAAFLTAFLRYEKWICVKALGKEVTKRIVGGNATIPVTLTPVMSENSEVKLGAVVGEIQADGSLGEVLRSGSFGGMLEEKIRTSIVAALNKAASLHAALPESLAGVAKIRRVAFSDSGAGHLLFDVSGEIALPFDQIQTMLEHK